jgi:hypothetical protein
VLVALGGAGMAIDNVDGVKINENVRCAGHPVAQVIGIDPFSDKLNPTAEPLLSAAPSR